jgi:hypothetical protein
MALSCVLLLLLLLLLPFRAHLVDARLDGGMLLELYSRDGVGTMISTDFYEGIRKAAPSDLEAVQVSGIGSRGRLVLPWYCLGTALVLPWYCLGTALVLPWYCLGTALVLP